MAEALRAGGLYYVEGRAVDSEGNEVKDAPKMEKDTLPSEQPGAEGMVTPEQRLAAAIADAIKPKASVKAAEPDEHKPSGAKKK